MRAPVIVLAVTWTLFWFGASAESYLSAEGPATSGEVSEVAAPVVTAPAEGSNLSALLYALVPCLSLLALWWVSARRDRWWPLLRGWLERCTDAADTLAVRFNWLWIALAAGAGLYAELVLIRFHGSTVPVFAFFKNTSLLSCFLGLGIGYALGRVRPLLFPLALPALALQMIGLQALRFSDLSAFLHNPVPEQFSFGVEYADSLGRLATIYGFLLFIFGFNALCFIPFGQLASRFMARSPRLVSYSWNLVGSLLGILLFYLLSFAWAPPVVWVAVLVILLLAFVRRTPGLLPTAVSAALLLGALGAHTSVSRHDVFSPYQLLTVDTGAESHPTVDVNHVYFQRIIDLAPGSPQYNTAAGLHYNLPYILKPQPADVLIVGSGTGNDVAAAVRNGSGHVDAVEIDPAIVEMGREFHPEAPYAAKNVSAHVDDGRAFLRKTDKKYDLIVYGLLDSHTLLSSMSGVRLDSYIYTVEAFRDARARLKDGGLICLSFCVLREDLGRKLYLMLKEAFDGRAPSSYQTHYDFGVCFVIGEGGMGYGTTNPPPPSVREVSAAFNRPDLAADVSTDDWPFFYMPVRKYPMSYVGMIVALLVLSFLFVRSLTPTGLQAAAADVRNSVLKDGREPPVADHLPEGVEHADQFSGFSLPCFLLGVGFMLIETKSVTELALVYGSTWVVIGVVIAAILLMAFLANLLVLRFGRINLTLSYVLLLASIVVTLLVPVSAVSGGTLVGSQALATALVTVPLFFSGLVFSQELDRSKSVAVAMSSNLLGAMVGGCLEYNSMYFGYYSLSVLALVLYALAFLSYHGSAFVDRRRRDPELARPVAADSAA